MSPTIAPPPKKQIIGSPDSMGWLQAQQISLACTTYQTSRLMLIGVNAAGNLSGFERIFDRAMGLYATSERLYLGTKYQIWQLDHVLQPGQQYQGYDRLYVPRIGHTTGDLDVHDIVAISDPARPTGDRLVFVATALNCLATVSDRHSCQPLWQPPFISKMINEDRCHLNGLAVVDQQPRYVSVVSRSDVVDGWRDRRRDGGLILEVPSGEVVASGLSMPHSPRWYSDRLWLLNSGRGEFGYVDVSSGRFEPVALCPGYLRGLAFYQDWAIVGLSKSRCSDQTFGGLELDDRLSAAQMEPQCGLMVINLKTGQVDHTLQIHDGVVTELYDVQVLPGVQHPMALGFQTDEIAQLITLEPLREWDEQTLPPHPPTPSPSTCLTQVTEQTKTLKEVVTLPFNFLVALLLRKSNLFHINCSVVEPATEPVIDPNAEVTAQALFDRSRSHKQNGELAAAEQCLCRAIQLKPNFWGAYNNLATLLQQRGDLPEAIECYEQALRFKPDFAEAIANRASIWQLQGELEKARPEFVRALQLKPTYVPAHLNLANLYKQQGRLGAAVDHFRQVIALDPDRTEAYFQLGQILEYQDQTEEALTCYEKILAIDPQAEYVHSFIAMLHLQFCDWQDYDRRVGALTALVEKGLTTQVEYRLTPYLLNFFPTPLDLHHRVAQNHAEGVQRSVRANYPSLRFVHSRRPATKLRIGYISPDFRDHAVGRLIYQIFQHHDRQQFDVYAYMTVDVNDIITEQIQKGCDRLTNLSALTMGAAAQQIYDDRLDVLIDLAGYTIGGGNSILSLQPAPIQAQFLGYPDTMGADFIQYAIADRWLISPEIAAHYTEKIVYVPQAFVGSSLALTDRAMTRQEFGLPDQGFVFCCFNTHRKINPEVFEAWMEILRQVPGSVLWLLDGLARTQANLRREAERRGVAGDRLVFSPRLSYAEYLAKYQFADLFLDTFLYSAGSTAVAALWGGTPLLTRLGQTNASRMGASITSAAHLDDLICSTTQDYIDRAVHLATHSQELSAIRQKLVQDRDRLPLFDVVNFTRGLEAAFREMVETHQTRSSLS